MKTSIRLALGVAALAAVFGAVQIKASAPAAVPKLASEPSANPKRGSIIRLHTSDGRFYCSGVIVGPKTLITANHCVDGALPGEEVAEVRDATKQPTGIVASFVAGNERADYAILTGDFSTFTIRAHTTKPSEILNNIENNERELMACGYPYGGDLLCAPVINRRMYAFYVAGAGFLYPGMSGGPVVDVASGRVIAVNSAVTDQVVLLSPLIEIYAALQITPE